MAPSPPTRASRRSTRPWGRHCHSWTVRAWTFSTTPATNRLRTFALGYLAHLAADSVAHNYFVPKQLAVTSSTSTLGHSYWESRFETHLGTECARSARDLILIDHSRSDGLLDRVLSPTIFSTPTNRRIFRGMVIAADSESWQRIFGLMTENSRWDLADRDVGLYLARSYDFVMDLLMRMESSEAFQLDPSGDDALRPRVRVAQCDHCNQAGQRCSTPRPNASSACRGRRCCAREREIETPLYTPLRSTSS